jgi:hypothetical protein
MEMTVDTGELKDIPDAVLQKAHRYGEQIGADKIVIGSDGRHKENYILAFWRGDGRNPFILGAIYSDGSDHLYSFHS